MFENRYFRRYTWERETIPYIVSKEQKSSQNIKDDRSNPNLNDLFTENKLLRAEILKLKEQIANLEIENNSLKKQLENANQQKLINQVDYKRSSSVPKFSLSSKIKNNLGTNIGQNNKPLIMKQENVK